VAKLRTSALTRENHTLIGSRTAPLNQRPPLSKPILLATMALETALYLRPESFYPDQRYPT